MYMDIKRRGHKFVMGVWVTDMRGVKRRHGRGGYDINGTNAVCSCMISSKINFK